MSDLDDSIVKHIKKAWDDHGTPLLLARLGACDNGTIARLAREQSYNLKTYLRSHLVDRVQVVQHSERPQLVGVLPVDVNVDSEGGADELLEKTQSTSKDATHRYHPAFWAAFRKPLDESKRRYLSVREPIRFWDLPEADAPDDHHEIASEYIVGPDVEPDQVQQKAQQWLANKRLQDSIYIYSLMTRPRSESIPSKDLLDRLLQSLDPEDLKRISMPLDVIRKLRRQRP